MNSSNTIPIKPLAHEFDTGIAVGRIESDVLPSFEEALQSHRHDFHFFLIQEKGTTYFEIDFEKHKVKTSTVLYIHPGQVHRIFKVDRVALYVLAISSENLNAPYMKLLESITPTLPLILKAEDFALIVKTISLCTTFFEKKHDKLYSSILKDSCNTLVALIASHYQNRSKALSKTNRFDTITAAFRSALEKDFITVKRPSDYASALNISTPYLNECVRTTTGSSASHHIQQRVILEAKRLLYHSDKSVKEIATELGYDDYAYFSRLFTKATGMTALTFRKKNLD